MRELHLLQAYEGVRVRTMTRQYHSYAIAKAFNRRILIHTTSIRIGVVDKSMLIRRCFINDKFNSGELDG